MKMPSPQKEEVRLNNNQWTKNIINVCPFLVIVSVLSKSIYTCDKSTYSRLFLELVLTLDMYAIFS